MFKYSYVFKWALVRVRLKFRIRVSIVVQVPEFWDAGSRNRHYSLEIRY